jgi:hypothetical protein
VNQQEWNNLQEVGLYVLLPVVEYGLAIFLAVSVVASIMWPFMKLFMRMTRRR